MKMKWQGVASQTIMEDGFTFSEATFLFSEADTEQEAARLARAQDIAHHKKRKMMHVPY